MLMSCTMAFSPSSTPAEMNRANRMRWTVLIQSMSVSVNMYLKTSHEARPQRNSDMGIWRAASTVAYWRVPELTTPQKNMKTVGSRKATSLATHMDSHEASI